ncbi:hypothetical protein B0H13DRAFT_1892073 [Mycena leptocephala]|nr:hypothetical protein B0H13DRAFT_1892073 [Mycena leptocephala]
MVYGEHVSFLYSVAKATKFAVDIHSKYIKEPEFADLLNIFTPDMRKLRVQHNLQPATTAFVLPRIRMPEAESAFVLSEDEMDEAPSCRCSSSKSRSTPSLVRRSPWRRLPRSSSPRCPCLTWPFRRAISSASATRDLGVPAAAAASARSDARRGTYPRDATHLRVDMLHEMLSNPPGDWVRGNAQPLPATQLVPTSFVQDGLVPALYSQAPFKCHTCINSKKRCHFRGMNSSCEECHIGKHNCSIVANPTRFLQNIEELRPMINLGPEVLSRALLRAIELRRDCDFVFAQLARLTSRLELALDEVVLRFSNINDILPQDYVRFIFENPGDVQLLEGLSERIRASRPHPVLELQHLENNPTSDIRARRTPGDPTTTNEYYVPEEPPLMTNAPSYTDIPTISSHRASIFAGQPYVETSAVEDRPGDPHPPLATVPAAPSQPHASPETYAVSPSSLVPSNAPSAVQTNASAAGSASTSASAGYHSISSARPFGTPGTLLHYPSEFSPGLPRGNHPCVKRRPRPTLPRLRDKVEARLTKAGFV